ncbi:MAG: hypothetical protein EBU90_15955 [Proteobacteria bacterium]|nr:hypothetical protein [Pseudomonadota bacterium]
MIYFKHLREEIHERRDPKSKTLHAFDMDEVLFHHDHSKVKVHVKDEHGKRVHSLTNTEYNDHKLKPGHSYDYSEFKSHKVFKKSAHPIHKMINKLRAIHKNNKNVEIVTARSDMDNKHGFMKTLKHHGIDARHIHVRRAGNTGEDSPAKAKHKVIGDLIKKHGYKKVHLYDDSHANLEHFKKLKHDHPDVEFHAHHVAHDPKTGNVKVTTTKA